jgi:glycosyltransferase involved in cell wall biosynthesis
VPRYLDTERDRKPVTFSVIVPAFRAAETIHATLESLLAQTYPAHEIIVVDDGSPDATADVVARFGASITLIRQANGGTASARNRGIAAATGDVVCFLDADDEYAPDRLAAVAEAFATEPELDAVLTDAALVEPTQTVLASSWWPTAAWRDRLDIRAKIIFCALCVRRSVLAELGPFDRRFHLLEDVEMWHRLVCRGYLVGYVDQPSYVYKINPVGKTQAAQTTNGEWELFRIDLRYACALRTPHQWRPRLFLRSLRHLRASLRARFER